MHACIYTCTIYLGSRNAPKRLKGGDWMERNGKGGRCLTVCR